MNKRKKMRDLGRLFWLLLLLIQQAFCLTPCLQMEEVNPKRYLMSRNLVQLKLAVSDRILHQLTTKVYQIFLTEVLGYASVGIVHYNSTVSINELLRRLWHVDGSVPEYVADLEVRIPVHKNPLEKIGVKDCGNLGPPGRYGWFIPKKLLSYQPQNRKEHIDHWKVFQSPETAMLFSLSEEDWKYVVENTLVENAVAKKYHCEKYFCETGIYTPKRCRDGKKCAVLITEDPDMTEFVTSDIERLSLYVRVAWVGSALKVVNYLTDKYYATDPKNRGLLVFLSYSPSILTLTVDHLSISFPPCDLFDNTTCSYVSQRLVKVAWPKLDEVALYAVQSLQKMEFRSEDLKEMVHDYNTEYKNNNGTTVNITQLACTWMRRHHNIRTLNTTNWSTWLTVFDSNQTIYIGGIFPMSGLHAAGGAVTGAIMAVNAVNRYNVIKHYTLDMKLDNGQCKADLVMKTFVEYMLFGQHHSLVGVLGPACSDTIEPLVGIAKHFKTVVISYSAEGSSFSDRKKYPYFFRTIGENKQFKYVFLELFKELNWKRVASLTEDGTKYTEYISLTQDLLQKNDITFVANRKFPQDWGRDSEMRQYLEEFKEIDARIIIADVNDEAARVVMCEAYHMKMTAKQGYVWFLPLWLPTEWYNTTIFNETRGIPLSCDTNQMIEAINGHLAITHTFFAPDDNIMQENITVRQWRDNYEKNCQNGSLTPSNYAGYAYDAIWTYAYALNTLFKENQSYISSLHDNQTVTKLVQIIQQTNFHGVSGHIYFGSGPSRYSTLNVIQWYNLKTKIVGTYYPNIPNITVPHNKQFVLHKEEIVWLNDAGTIPSDGGPCIIYSFAALLNVDCQAAIIVANLLGIALLILFLLIGFLVIKHRYDKKVQLTQKYMKSLGIDLLSVSTMGGLDSWEIPKDRVVINRKLGEGAFGTVYGGEAYFNEKGWLAVAVKTLKVGSTTEEKLDFLSEAEVMKRFDHKNIVQLLGVCTKNEPVYTIMEFMLYGDLKTFLLARRHLVNEKVDDNDEISNKKLTNMALDIARALSYLAQLKYVHRDVASRNCLVNVSRIVKLADFGMTRPMFENDYYRFNRKGMLPVRWMAPESLALGVFTPASDVWSYGVLLYEVITFGNFPFQGMSNNQVLDHVKAGNTLTIPTAIKPQLDSLIKSCWNKDYKKRPQASEIVEFLANNPRLISPCLDVPLSSVQLEGTGQLEMSIADPDKPRKFSMTLRQRSPSSCGGSSAAGGGCGTLVGGGCDSQLWNEVAQPLLPSPNRYKPTRTSSISEEAATSFEASDSLL
uniref:Gamma-aminobutyric acid type B receptor subunit 2 n=1 Tax=Panstrongylus lignarius TaxID=156445 RepID=A0A224XI24_9HEMI